MVLWSMGGGKGTCKIEDCGKPVDNRGWCRGHYRRWQRYGDPLGRPPKPTAQERFWAKVNKNGPIPSYAPHLGPCWLWLAGTGDGYGKFWLDGHALAHRVAYEWLAGPIPEGLHLDHLCRVTTCMNPAHLEPVTVRVNSLRGVGFCAQNVAKAHCPAGHEYNEANTYVDPDGGRQCKACHRARWQEASRLAGIVAHTARTHCPEGHEYDEANTYVYKGHRHCRICKRERQRTRRAVAAA